MKTDATPFEALQAALIEAGSQSELARICGVGQPAVSKWFQSGKRLPAEYVIAVERETRVSKHMLRPDIYPVDLSSPSLDDESVTEGAPVVLSDRGAVSHKAGGA